LLVLSNSNGADIFRASAVASGKDTTTITISNVVNTLAGLGGSYKIGDELLVYHPRVYFIRRNPNGDPALYRLDYTGTNAQVDEIIEGVENMQIVYGVDSTGDKSADQYLTANSVTSWFQVVSVRIDLTLRSTGIDAGDNIAATPSSYTFDSSAMTDRRLRRSFSSTIYLRNGMPQ
jgi:type IV pilus assembly protein PilW